MFIGELARAAGVSTSAIRLWEREGLLPRPARTPRGFRDYDEDAVIRVRIVAGMRRLKTPLEQVRSVMRLHEEQVFSLPPEERPARPHRLPGEDSPIDAARRRVQSRFEVVCQEAAELGGLLDALETVRTHPEVLACDGGEDRGMGTAQARPNESMASETRMKDAMFAPRT